MSSLIYQLLIIFILFLIGSLISLFMNALLFARHSELEEKVRQNNKNAQTALDLCNDEESILLTGQILKIVFLISAILFGNFFFCDDISRLMKIVLSSSPEKLCSIIGLLVYIFIITPVSMLIFETLPRKIGENQSMQIAIRSAPVMKFMVTIISPFRSIFSAISQPLTHFSSPRKVEDHNGITEEKILDMIDDAAEAGEFTKTEQVLIKSVFEFSDTMAQQCMTPRTDISAVDIEAPIERIMSFVRSEGYSRYPIYRGDYDHIIGVLFSRDIINLLVDNKLFTIQDLIRPAYFVPDSKKISEVLADFQSKQIHMAIVLDEFGGTAGIITIEDIIEEIVGEIQDEYDEEETLFKLLKPNLVEVNARIDVDDFNERFDSDLPEDQADSIGGLIFTTLGELPLLRQRIQIGCIQFQVLTLDGNRIEKVLARKTTTDQPTDI